MEHNSAIKTYMAIMAERDAAMLERNMALDERRRAFAERHMALLQRDAAIAERNSALEDRDKALAALHFRERSMNENMSPPDSPEKEAVRGRTKPLNHHHHQQMHSIPQFSETAYDPREIPTTGPFESRGVAYETANKPREVKQTKEIKGSSTKKSKSPRKGKRGIEQDSGVDGMGLNQINFDESAMPVPVCSCTGVPQPCHKSGNGGWQSACCTTTLSMYPLPPSSGKRHARVAGRKMSGGVFTKLLNRLAAEGHDPYAQLDLKDHWAKHGTNRYSTFK